MHGSILFDIVQMIMTETIAPESGSKPLLHSVKPGLEGSANGKKVTRPHITLEEVAKGTGIFVRDELEKRAKEREKATTPPTAEPATDDRKDKSELFSLADIDFSTLDDKSKRYLHKTYKLLAHRELEKQKQDKQQQQANKPKSPGRREKDLAVLKDIYGEGPDVIYPGQPVLSPVLPFVKTAAKNIGSAVHSGVTAVTETRPSLEDLGYLGAIPEGLERVAEIRAILDEYYPAKKIAGLSAQLREETNNAKKTGNTQKAKALKAELDAAYKPQTMDRMIVAIRSLQNVINPLSVGFEAWQIGNQAGQDPMLQTLLKKHTSADKQPSSSPGSAKPPPEPGPGGSTDLTPPIRAENEKKAGTNTAEVGEQPEKHETIINPESVKIIKTQKIDPEIEGTIFGDKELGISNLYELDIKDSKEYEDIIRALRISDKADEFQVTPEEKKRLEIADLKDAGLMPRYIITAEDATYLLSAPYMVDEDRIAYTGYVKEADPNNNNNSIYKARTYYLSLSQETWRYLVDYEPDGRTGIHWYGKGYTEDSINIPIPIQEAMYAILIKKGPMVLPPGKNPNFYFAGTTHENNRHENKGTYYVEVGKTPFTLDGNLEPPKRYDKDGKFVKLPPETVHVTQEAQRPDFSKNKLIKVEYNLGGQIRQVLFDIYPSHDGKLRYMFKRKGNKAGLAIIETTNPITDVGLRQHYVNPGDLATPIYEYDIQTGGYGDENDKQNKYVGMFNNYISKIPLIQEYMKAVGIQ